MQKIATRGVEEEPGKSAPVIGVASLQVRADPWTVWRILSDIDRWAVWNPAVDHAHLEGPLAPGTIFKWEAGTRITSTLLRVEAPCLLMWSGRTMGIRAFHTYRLAPEGAGTRVETEETFSGWVARLFNRPLQKMLDQALAAGLESLKAEAERPRE